MRLLLRVFFGQDVSFGILWYVLVSLYFSEYFNPKILTFSIFCAISPDIDFLPWKIFRRKFNIQSHQDIFHHPIFFIPLMIGIGVIIAQFVEVEESFVSVIAVGSLFFHFYHDSLSDVGMHWISPFLWGRITMSKGIIPKKVDKKYVDDFYDRMNQLEKGTKNFMEAITKRSAKTEGITVWKIMFWAFCVCFCFVFAQQLIF